MAGDKLTNSDTAVETPNAQDLWDRFGLKPDDWRTFGLPTTKLPQEPLPPLPPLQVDHDESLQQVEKRFIRK